MSSYWMTTLLLLAGLFANFLPLHAEESTDEQTEQPTDFPVATLNVDKIFKTYQPLQDRLAPLKQKARELDKDVQLKQVELETATNKARKTPPGTPDFEKLQVLLAKMQAELRLFVERERRNLQKEEAVIFSQFYQEMEVEVKRICKERKIRLVLRQNDGGDTDNSVEAVLKSINRGIVYDEGLNITDEVMAALNAKKPE